MKNGIAASSGVAIGKVLLKIEEEIRVEEKKINDTESEVNKFKNALDESIKQIKKLEERLTLMGNEEEAKIFEAHKMILEDPEMIVQIENSIKTESVNAEYAVNKVCDIYIDMFKNFDDEYMRGRAADLVDIKGRIIKNILGVRMIDLSNLDEQVIIVAEELFPSDTAQLDREKVLGFVTELGGMTAHSAIMARTLEIPAVVGVNGILEAVKDGDIISFDGDSGEVYINPTDKIIEEFKKRNKKYKEFKTKLNKYKNEKSVTVDGHHVEIYGNIGTQFDIDAVKEYGGEGVGLYRTEFLYMDREELPSEEEQFEAYKIVAEKMEGRSVIIRTLDIGGDKELPYMDLPAEMNPFLGYRAIRLCLDRIDIFKTQLRAILRASAYGNIRIMFPMISAVEELRASKKILEEVKKELKIEGFNIKDDIKIGMMIEVPSAAILSDIFAKEVDFFSIGTNDLIQYLTAVDRGNKTIANLYTQYHPALIRTLKHVIVNAHKEGTEVGMCGEAAANPKLIPVLLGLGLDEFSMSAGSILRARATINNMNKKECDNIVEEVLKLSTADEIEEYLKENVKVEI